MPGRGRPEHQISMGIRAAKDKRARVALEANRQAERVALAAGLERPCGRVDGQIMGN